MVDENRFTVTSVVMACVPGLFFLHLFQKRTFWDKWNRPDALSDTWPTQNTEWNPMYRVTVTRKITCWSLLFDPLLDSKRTATAAFTRLSSACIICGNIELCCLVVFWDYVFVYAFKVTTTATATHRVARGTIVKLVTTAIVHMWAMVADLADLVVEVWF